MSAGPVFQLWLTRKTFARTRTDVFCPAYARFRSAGRNLMRHLLAREEDAATILLDSVHNVLGEVATIPIELDAKLTARVSAIGGGIERMRALWGPDCARALREFIDSTAGLCSDQSALRDAVLQTLVDELDSDLRFYSHRSAVEAYLSLGASEAQAIVTPDAYRKAGVFDALMKVGPIRSMGFGRMPESIIASPRFTTLRQIAWAEDADEPNFGEAHMDPLGFSVVSHWELSNQPIRCRHARCANGWSKVEEDDDDFDQLIRTRISRSRGSTLRGTILRLSGSRILTQRPGSEIATFVPMSGRVQLKEAEDVCEGDIILRHAHISLDLGPVATTNDPIVREWREALRHKHAHNTLLFLGELKKQGIPHVHLGAAVNAWMTNQRPQQEAHFEIVSRVIGWEASKYRKVWRVFSDQHGAAVQHGLIGAQLATEALVKALNGEQTLLALQEYSAHATSEPLRLIVDLSGSSLEVLGFPVDEIESCEQVFEKNLDEIIEESKEYL